MKRNLKINIPNSGQNFTFINVFSEVYANKLQSGKYEDEIQAVPYMPSSDTDIEKKNNSIALLNYEKTDNVLINGEYKTIEAVNGYGILRGGSGGQTLDIFKQEIDKNGNPLTPLELVARDLDTYQFRDYNISNRRNYRYFIYLSQSGQLSEGQNRVIYKNSFDIGVNWQQWSITELHPTDETLKTFTASPDDVWLFNLNVETGEQTQNIVRNAVNTLGTYQKFSQGKANYVSGTVSCLLGPDVISVGEALKNGLTANEAGYFEMRKYIDSITSNQRVDMLKAWRKLVMSSNPKLLKDREGQAFLVTLTNSSNKPMDNVRFQPNTINFGWTQIGTLDGVTIIDDFSTEFGTIFASGTYQNCTLSTPNIVIDIEKILNTPV